MTQDIKDVLKLALEALELMYACYVNPKWVSHKQQESQILEQTLATITAIKEALAQPEPMQVTIKDFVAVVEGKEGLVGRPVYWAKWPNKETL